MKKYTEMIKRAAFLTLLIVVGFSAGVFAHGVNTETSFHAGVAVVRSTYSPEQPLADALVTIYSPGDRINAWQTGRTDKTGHFAFLPDIDGEWIFFVDDQKGHSKKTAIIIEPDKTESPEPDATDDMAEHDTPGSGPGTFHRIILGLALIFGITGIFYGFRSRQSRKQIHKDI